MRRKAIKKKRARLVRPATTETPQDSSTWGAGILGEEETEPLHEREEAPARTREREEAPARTREREQAPTRTREREQAPTRTREREQAPTRTREREEAPARTREREQAPARTREREQAPARTREREQAPARTRGREQAPVRVREAPAPAGSPRKPELGPPPSSKSAARTLETRNRSDVNLSDEELRDLFVGMLRIRVVDDRMLKLQRQGRISFYGAASGQEAAVVGSARALQDRDWVVPALREGGVLLLRDWPLELYVAQCFATHRDVCKGRQMPAHYSDRSVRVVSWSSCIATQLPHATGMAMAARIRGDDVVVMGYMGDGATSESDFHTALNFAGVSSAPVVFFCQNNQWAISLPLDRQTASETIAIKAEAYGFPGVQIDGNDVLAVLEATSEAAARARRGDGPTLIEALTYRMGAHSTSDDPTRYRDSREVDEWAARDPIDRYRNFLDRAGLWNERWERGLREEMESEILETIRIVETQSPPAPDTLFQDVYAAIPRHLAEQAASFLDRPVHEAERTAGVEGEARPPRRRRRRRTRGRDDGAAPQEESARPRREARDETPPERPRRGERSQERRRDEDREPSRPEREREPSRSGRDREPSRTDREREPSRRDREREPSRTERDREPSRHDRDRQPSRPDRGRRDGPRMGDSARDEEARPDSRRGRPDARDSGRGGRPRDEAGSPRDPASARPRPTPPPLPPAPAVERKKPEGPQTGFGEPDPDHSAGAFVRRKKPPRRKRRR